MRRTRMILVDVNESTSKLHTRTVNLDQLLHDGAITGTSHDSASDTEVTVKPWSNAVTKGPIKLSLKA